MSRRIFLLFFFLSGTITASFSGTGWHNARVLAMAGAGLSLDDQSVPVNPAQLALRGEQHWKLSLMQIGGLAANDALRKDHYDRYNGAFLDEAAKKDLLNAIPAVGLDFYGCVEAQPLALQYGSFAFSTQLTAAVNGRLAKETCELLLYGNELDRVYHFNPLAGDALVVSSYALSFGRSFPCPRSGVQHLGAGVSVKYLRGHAFEQITDIDAETVTRYTSLAAKGSAHWRRAQGGDGLGVDVGLTATFLQHWRASLVVENAFGQITWNRTPEAGHAEFSVVSSTVERIVADDLDFDEVVLTQDTTRAIAAFAEQLPVLVRLGFGREFKSWRVAVELFRSSRQSAWAGDKTALAAGVEYRAAQAVFLRAGARLGDHLSPACTAGLGLALGPMRWDVAVMPFAGLAPGQLKGVALATGMTFHF